MEYKSSKTITFTSCFISPSGTFYPVPFSGHSAFARQWSMDDIDPVGDLERRGWIHISEEDGYVGVFTGGEWGVRPDIPQAQVDVLFDMLMDAPKGMRVMFMRKVRQYIEDFGEQHA